ncbi:MAG: hypothetical protein IPH50_14945 [Rhodanobacteraceae bacterium]|nr:hypothetical protein [Rhodanobacteraceae bacterium]
MADEKLEQALVDFGTKNAAALFEASDLLDKFITQVGERALSVVARKCSVADKDCANRGTLGKTEGHSLTCPLVDGEEASEHHLTGCCRSAGFVAKLCLWVFDK